jgi:rhodanese-related sulfurtransferase
MKNILAANAWNLLKDKPNSFLIDVRTEDERLSYGYPDLSTVSKEALHIVWENNDHSFMIALKKAFPERHSHILFICRSGVRSFATASLAAIHSYEHCYNIVGGFQGWQNHSLPYKMPQETSL